jgi:hypothetical protein
MKTEEVIKAIAIDDAGKAYRDLSVYKIDMVRKGTIWEVAFNFKDETINGGGPYYEIDAETGNILKKIYYQ